MNPLSYKHTIDMLMIFEVISKDKNASLCIFNLSTQQFIVKTDVQRMVNK